MSVSYAPVYSTFFWGVGGGGVGGVSGDGGGGGARS